MATVRPFAAYRPAPEHVSRVACPPYDVIDTAEARALAEGNEQSFLHVTRPEIDLPPGVDEHDDAVYARGARNLTALCANRALVQDQEPHLYLYAQTMGAHTQVGVVGCASVAEYVADTIKKHEKTRADKEDDRTRHIDELGAHDEPVFLTYRAVPAIDALVREVTQSQPIYDFVTGDRVGHKLWLMGRALSQQLCELFEVEVPVLYVADGHHRSAAAARVHARRKGDGGEHDVFLAVVFPHDQLRIMPYNRVVRDTQGRSVEALLGELRARFDLEARPDAEAATPTRPKEMGLFLDGRWWLAKVRPGTYDAADPVASLDCSVCQDQLLGPVFGVTDPRRDKHVDFVGGIRGAAELERRVRAGMTLGVHLYPTQIGELFQVSDAGLLMPPKSTWFEPKLRSGLFVHTF